jgi:hypothetical protein
MGRYNPTEHEVLGGTQQIGELRMTIEELKITDVDTRQEAFFAISGPVICGPDGSIIDTEDMNLPSNDLIGIIEWTLSQDLGPNKIPVAVCKLQDVVAVDQQKLYAVMQKYESQQLRTISSKEFNKMKRKEQQKIKREMQTDEFLELVVESVPVDWDRIDRN